MTDRKILSAETETGKPEISETPDFLSNISDIRAVLDLLFLLPAVFAALPVFIITLKCGGMIQSALFAGAIFCIYLMSFALEGFIEFRLYCTETDGDRIDRETSKKTAFDRQYISETFPELAAVRLSRTMTRKEKRRAADKAAFTCWFDNWAFKAILILFAVCLSGWLFYPVFSGSGAITPVVTEFSTNIKKLWDDTKMYNPVWVFLSEMWKILK